MEERKRGEEQLQHERAGGHMPAKVTLVGAMVISLIAATTAFSATDAHLAGAFDVKAKIVQSSFDPGSVGTKNSRTYKFIPKCDVGPCGKVVFKRQTGGGHYDTSTLHRTAPGVYEGTEVDKGSYCEGKPPGAHSTTLRVKHHVKILKEDVDGNATKIKGQSRYKWAHHCGTQGSKWVGTLR